MQTNSSQVGSGQSRFKPLGLSSQPRRMISFVIQKSSPNPYRTWTESQLTTELWTYRIAGHFPLSFLTMFDTLNIGDWLLGCINNWLFSVRFSRPPLTTFTISIFQNVHHWYTTALVIPSFFFLSQKRSDFLKWFWTYHQ